MRFMEKTGWVRERESCTSGRPVTDGYFLLYEHKRQRQKTLCVSVSDRNCNKSNREGGGGGGGGEKKRASNLSVKHQLLNSERVTEARHRIKRGKMSLTPLVSALYLENVLINLAGFEHGLQMFESLNQETLCVPPPPHNNNKPTNKSTAVIPFFFLFFSSFFSFYKTLTICFY